MRDISIIGICAAAQIERAARRVRRARAADDARIIVMHHNPVKGELSQRHGLKNTQRILGAFAEMGVDLVLCGHDHQEAVHYIEHTKRGTIISTSGTISNRIARRTPVVREQHSHHDADDRGLDAGLVGRPTGLRRRTGEMLLALKSLFRRGTSTTAAARRSSFDAASPPPPPTDADELLARLRGARAQAHRALPAHAQSQRDGELPRRTSCACTTATSTAPDEMHRAIVAFVEGRTRAERRTAQRQIVSFTIVDPRRARPPRRETHASRGRADRREAHRVARALQRASISAARCKRRSGPRVAPHEEPARPLHRGAPAASRRDRDQRAASAPTRLEGGAAHAAARDGASVAGRDRAPDRPRSGLSRESEGGGHRPRRAKRGIPRD